MTDPAIESAIRLGWPIIKLSSPTGGGQTPGKQPVTKGWPDKPGLDAGAATYWLKQAGGNIGIICGERAGRLIVLDYDGDVPQDMPATVRVETGGGGLHDYYRVPDGVDIGKANRVKFPYRGCLIDARWTGGQVCYPPSVHAETGAVYCFAEGRSPDEIEVAPCPADAIAAILATQAEPAHVAPLKPLPAPGPVSDNRAEAIIAAACAAVAACGEGGRNNELNRWAFTCGGIPGANHEEITERLLAASTLPRGEALKCIRSGLSAGAGTPLNFDTDGPGIVNDLILPRDELGRPLPPGYQVETGAPRHIADKYLADFHGDRTLQYWRGAWYRYDGQRYIFTLEKILHADISEQIRHWYYMDARSGKPKQVVMLLKEGLLRDVTGQLRQPGRTIMPESQNDPVWIGNGLGHPPEEFISMKNGLLHMPTRTLHPHTPAYFTTTALPFDYDPDARAETWINFLTNTWPDDAGIDCAALLGEFFGFCLSRDMSHHKMLWIIGPTRGGKGLMSRILMALLGDDNCANPTLGALGDKHGGQVLIDKRLAVVGDARLGHRVDQSSIVERLLSLSGGDAQTFPRKYLPDWCGKPSAKFLLLSNELPGLTDASGALTGRLLMLQTHKSHLGREDLTLEPRIREELQGVFNWTLDGLDRLKRQGRFTSPAASDEILNEQRRLASPVMGFVQDACVVAENATSTREEMYDAYLKWADDGNTKKPMNKSWFGRSLKHACPGVGTSQINRIWCYSGIRPESQIAKPVSPWG